VAEGDVLGVLEAMKMELALRAPFDGVVTAVRAAAGEQVALGAALFAVSSGGDSSGGDSSGGDSSGGDSSGGDSSGGEEQR
jgi:pyruvate/2-oxoglutarate dehydrogenase complex dihydrolipoamide acyltransferase (E2) component